MLPCPAIEAHRLNFCPDSLVVLECKPMTVQIQFLPDDVFVDAQPGEPLLKVAERAGLTIPTGCLMGSCHACEVEIQGLGEVCSCITAVPAGQAQLTINLFVDPTW